MDDSFVVTEDIIRHKHKVTPYLGRELEGVVRQTFLNGTTVFANGEMQLNCSKLLKHELNRMA